MKKILAILTAFALAFIFVPNMEAKASGYSGSLSGPSSAYAGDTVTVSLNISAQNLTGANGAVSCDKGTINSMSTPLSGWYCGSGASFIIYENIGDFVGVSGSNTVLNISVTLSSALAPGENVTVNVSNCEITYEGENLTYGVFNASHTITINQPVVNTPEEPPAQTPTESTPSETPPSESTPSQSTPSQSPSSGSTSSGNTSSQSSSSQSKEEKETEVEVTEEATEATDEVTEEVKEEKEDEKKEETKKEETSNKEETKEKPKREKFKLKIKINISKENWVGFFWGIGTVLVLEGIGVLAFFLWKRSSWRKENEKIH